MTRPLRGAWHITAFIWCLHGCTSTAPERQSVVSIGTTAVVLAPGETTTVGFVLDDGVRKFELPPRAYPPPPENGNWASSAPAVSVNSAGRVTAEALGLAFVAVSIDNRRDSALVTVTTEAEARSDYAAVSPGLAHTCGLDTSGRLLCWGTNWHGELGNGRRKLYTAHLSPMPVLTSDTYVALSAGGEYTCALRSDGRVACWGYSVGSSGASTLDVTTPVVVNTAAIFTAISSGSDHRCGLTSAGIAYCWGLNALGQLGTGDTRDRDVPAAVTGDLRFVSISAGDLHTCGVTISGDAYCWGDNVYGELGTGEPSAASSTPVLVTGGLSFRAMSAGTESTCAVATDGRAYCWGLNARGNLGTGDLLRKSSPQLVATTTLFASISTRSRHTCGLDMSGTAYCWGDNTWGQLGTGVVAGQVVGSSDPYVETRPVAVHGSVAFSQLEVGNDYSCGVTTSGGALCWGVNRTGQLGIGRRRTPVARDYTVTTPMESEPTVVRRP